MYKFRSMCVGAEERLAELLDRNEKDGPVFKIADDPRVTRVGRWIRKLSLDELPQFVNVLKCTSEEFVLADELCCNAAILRGREDVGDMWFPKTYIYDRNYVAISRYANGLRSASRLEKAAKEFGFENVAAFMERFKEIEAKVKAGEYKDYGYRDAYGSAPFLCQFVASEQLGEKV